MIEVNYNDYKRVLEENMRLIPENYKLKKEVERLNNIIDELEKWCNEEMYADDQLYEKVLDKLQKLKGVDKE